MNRYFTAILIALGCFLCQACSHFDDLNKDRYSIYDASPATFVQTITFTTQSRVLSSSYSMTSQLVQHAISVSTSESSIMLSNYECNSTHADAFWSLYYQKGYAESMLAEAKKTNDPALQAVALVLRTYVMQIITDVYGDVPYFQAGLMPVQPDNVETNIKYDSQKEIYKDMLLSLERANTLFQDKEARNFTAVLDNTYGGIIANWRRLGNTLYLRLLMRMSLKVIEEDAGIIDLGEEYGAFDVRNKIAEIYDGFVNNNGKYPIFRSVDDRALVHYNTMSAAYYTPFYQTTTTLFNQVAACETLMNELKRTDDAGKLYVDPRLYYYFTRSVGLPVHRSGAETQEFLDNNPVGYYASGNYGDLKQAESYSFMNYSEPLFIFAEAGCREWIPISAKTTKELYLDACEASMIEWNPNDNSPKDVSTREDYISYLDTSYDFGKALETIMTQKWIATFWYGVEAWSDYRRTGYPILKTNGPEAQNNKILCTRMVYPYTEAYQNGKCYQEAVNGWLGGSDDMQTDMWFADTQESKSIRRKGRQ